MNTFGAKSYVVDKVCILNILVFKKKQKKKPKKTTITWNDFDKVVWISSNNCSLFVFCIGCDVLSSHSYAFFLNVFMYEFSSC